MIRVLRVIEYEYDTAERMVEDMARWSHTSPAPRRSGMSMQSHVVSTTVVPDIGMRTSDHPFEGDPEETVGGGTCRCGLQRNDSIHDDPREVGE